MLAIVVLTAAGCRGSTSGVLDLPADEVLAAAVERSGEYDTARMRIRTVDITPEMGELRSTADGVSGGGRGWFTLTLESEPEPIEAELRFVDGIAYQRAEVLQVAYETDAEWISYDLGSAAPGGEAMRRQVRQYDPKQALAQLREITRVSEVGPATIDGFSTTHYTASTTMRAALLGATGVDEAGIQEFADLIGADLDATVPLQVWIDERGLVRRTRVQLKSDTSSTDTTTDMLEYGVSVDVVAPPADQTVSMEDLQG